jgi:hypothetical protein
MRRWQLCGSILASTLAFGCGTGLAQQGASTEIAGGRGGAVFNDPEPEAGARVLEVQIRAGDQIDSVQLVFALSDGSSTAGPRHGGSGGRSNVFRLDSDEYIVGLSGRCGDYIDSIRIHTNKRTSALFGGRGGDRDFQINVPAGNKAVGFSGRAGGYLDAIGLIYVPIRQLQAGQTNSAGGTGGSAFSDPDIPLGARISEVRVWAGDHIDAIQAVYLQANGRVLEGIRHGGSGGRMQSFRLDSDEYITGISGRYGDYIDSLRIQTNKRSSQSFGGRGGNRDFRIDVPAGNQSTGFVGRAADFVDSIGLNYREIRSAGRQFLRQRRARP